MKGFGNFKENLPFHEWTYIIIDTILNMQQGDNMNDSNLVTLTCSNMRSWGRQALSGRWSMAVLGTILLSALTALPILLFSFIFDINSLDYISDLYAMLISGPLSLGYIMFIQAIFRRNNTSPMEIFNGFERFGKALGLFLLMNILILLWSLLFIIPGIIASYRYALAFYIMADHPEMGILEIIGESKRLMRGNKWKLFCLHISFIGWILLTILTAGIGYFWLLPYITASTVGFYEVASGNLRPQYPRLSPEAEDGGPQ